MRAVAAVLLWLALGAAAPPFDPVAFFRGHTHGDGRLKVVLKATKTVTVDTLGRDGPDGTLVLTQTIRHEGKAPRTRTWRLKDLGNGRFSGTLSDAAGPVRIERAGAGVRVRYRDKDNIEIDQLLTPAGPNKVNNKLKARRFGMVVAHLDEVITKAD